MDLTEFLKELLVQPALPEGSPPGPDFIKHLEIHDDLTENSVVTFRKNRIDVINDDGKIVRLNFDTGEIEATRDGKNYTTVHCPRLDQLTQQTKPYIAEIMAAFFSIAAHVFHKHV